MGPHRDPPGELPVSKVHPGTLVWTLDAAGNRVAAPVLNVGSTPTRAGHQVVHLQLADGRSVDVSPGHPLASAGRPGTRRPARRPPHRQSRPPPLCWGRDVGPAAIRPAPRLLGGRCPLGSTLGSYLSEPLASP